jgi:hypothetical protein
MTKTAVVQILEEQIRKYADALVGAFLELHDCTDETTAVSSEKHDIYFEGYEGEPMEWRITIYHTEGLK